MFDQDCSLGLHFRQISKNVSDFYVQGGKKAGVWEFE
jgi:hypothetical protein